MNENSSEEYAKVTNYSKIKFSWYFKYDCTLLVKYTVTILILKARKQKYAKHVSKHLLIVKSSTHWQRHEI